MRLRNSTTKLQILQTTVTEDPQQPVWEQIRTLQEALENWVAEASKAVKEAKSDCFEKLQKAVKEAKTLL